MSSKNDLKWSPGNFYNRYSDFLKAFFGKKMQKISIDAGFTCPNIDGTISRGGCIYCNNASFSPNFEKRKLDIDGQIELSISKFRRKYPNMGYLAYFQSNTNTYGDIEELYYKYSDALNNSAIEGLIIATRPDSLPDSVIELLVSLNKIKPVFVEIGIESINNDTLKLINRGHTFEQTVDSVNKLTGNGLMVGGHFIIGLPGESFEQIIDSVPKINTIPLHSIKLHQLQIIKGTVLSKKFRQNKSFVNLFSVDQYVDLCIRFAELLNPKVIIERFSSQSPTNLLEFMNWDGIRNYELADKIVSEMKRRKTFQSRLYQN